MTDRLFEFAFEFGCALVLLGCLLALAIIPAVFA